MGSNSVATGLIQMTCGADRQANLEKSMTMIREAANRGAKIICLQELFSSTYFCWEENHDYFSLAEVIPGPSTTLLGDLAHELDVVIVASLFEKRAAGVYHNTVAVIDADGAYLGKYRKHHIPDDPGYYEKFYFAPGDDDYRRLPCDCDEHRHANWSQESRQMHKRIGVANDDGRGAL